MATKAATASQKGLAITAQQGTPLSKKQLEFNKLTNKIEKLRKQIADYAERNDAYIKAVGEYLIPAQEAFAKAQLELAAVLEAGALTYKFSKAQKEDIGTCIKDLCDQAFQIVAPSDEEKALYDRWSEHTYEQELEWQQEEEKDMMESMLEDFLGVEIDLDELRDDPEKQAELQEEIKRKMGERTHANAKKNKRQTKAQEAKEAKRKAAEELKTKSVRSIYISLAKLIHPDRETDPSMRESKEEEMKKLSAAYEKNDLTTLLAMEMAWIHKQNDHLGSISEDKLALYVEVLKDQARELEQEKWSYNWDPRFEMIREYTRMSMKSGLRRIKEDARAINGDVIEVNREVRSLQGSGAKRAIINFVEDFLDEMDSVFWF